MAKFICEGEKYQVAGQTGDSICLSVAVSGLPEKLEIEGHTLLLKTEFHVTLIAIGRIIERHKVTTPDFVSKVVEDFCAFVKENPVELVRYRDEYKFVSREERKTVVVMCDVSNLDKFFDLINKKYNITLEYPPTHVTLYTLQPNLGIFLLNSNDILDLTTPLPAPIKL